MKVILSIDAIKFPLTGIGRYNYELAKQLSLMSDLELSFFKNGKFISVLPEPTALQPRKMPWLQARLRKSDFVIKSYQVLSTIRDQFALKNEENAIFHGPKYYLPKFSGASVATFHDLSIFTHPKYHPLERVRYMESELRLTLKRASILITDSDFVRHELASYCGYPLDKIRTVPLACSDDFRPRQKAETCSVLTRLGLLHGAYTLYAGTIEPRKNIDTLLDAYSLLPQAIKQSYPLVLAGYHGWGSEKLHNRIKTAENEGWLRYLGYVSDADLPYLFSGAHLFFFPSHYEGFGLPVLEAMASGVPVICSNTSSLTEVVAGVALMFEPNDVDTLGKLILIGLEDDEWRNAAKKQGLQQALKFSWQKCAQQTVAVYRELLGCN